MHVDDNGELPPAITVGLDDEKKTDHTPATPADETKPQKLDEHQETDVRMAESDVNKEAAEDNEDVIVDAAGEDPVIY